MQNSPLVPHAINFDVNAKLPAGKCSTPKPISDDIAYATMVDTTQADRKALRDCRITADTLPDAIKECNQATAEYNMKINPVNKNNWDAYCLSTYFDT